MANPTTFTPQQGLTGVPYQYPVGVFATDGAIDMIAGGIAVLTKGSAGAYTLAAPYADGALLIITSTTAQAHVVTVASAASGGGSGQDVGTFGGAINDSCTLVSYNGKWYIAGAPRNVTFA